MCLSFQVRINPPVALDFVIKRLENGGNLFEGTFKDDRYDEGKLTMLDNNGNPDAYYVGTFKVNPNNSNPDAEPYNGTWYTKDGKENGKVVNWKEGLE